MHIALQQVKTMGKIKCAVVGVGNCFAGLVQGIEYYRQNPDAEVIGVMHQVIAGYSIYDLDFVAGFDVDANKVGKPLSEAVYTQPNKVNWVPKLSTMHDVIVKHAGIVRLRLDQDYVHLGMRPA